MKFDLPPPKLPLPRVQGYNDGTQHKIVEFCVLSNVGRSRNRGYEDGLFERHSPFMGFQTCSKLLPDFQHNWEDSKSISAISER